MPSRPIFLSKAARRNYRLAQFAAALIFAMGAACLCIFLYFCVTYAFS